MMSLCVVLALLCCLQPTSICQNHVKNIVTRYAYKHNALWCHLWRWISILLDWNLWLWERKWSLFFSGLGAVLRFGLAAVTDGWKGRKSARHINQVPLVHQDVLRLSSEKRFFGLFSADAGHHSLDPVELGAIGKVCMVGNNKCEGEEGRNGRWLLCPSQYKVEDGKWRMAYLENPATIPNPART